MTGTHPRKTGLDYEAMMQMRKNEAISEGQGSLSRKVAEMAKALGLEASSQATICDMGDD